MPFGEKQFENPLMPSPEKPEEIGKETSEKRFTLSREEFAEERIDAIKDVVKESKQKHPEVLSLSMFGSMVIGKARPESDIDGYLFVDADAIAKKLGRKEDDILDKTETDVEYFKEDQKLKIPDWGQEIKDQLKEKLNLSSEQVKHIRTRPISEGIIDRHIDGLMEQIQKVEDYQQQFKQWEASEPKDSNSVEDLEKLTKYYKQKPEHPGLPNPSTNLFGMFHLETGGGIKKYREYLIDKLAASGEMGEKAWEEIITKTEMLEQHLETDTNKTYPRTLEEAQKVYGRMSLRKEEKESQIFKPERVAGGKPEETKEKEKTPEQFDFEKAKSVFNRNTSAEERKEAVEIIKKISGPELTKKALREFDPFKPELKVEFRDGKKKEAPVAYHYDDETGKEISYEINAKASYSKKTEEKLFDAIAMGLHEIRHRAQYKNSGLKKLTFEDINGRGLFNREFESRLKDIEKRPGVKNNLRQMDAVIFSEIAAFLYKNGASIQEIKNLVGLDGQELVKNLQKRKEKN